MKRDFGAYIYNKVWVLLVLLLAATGCSAGAEQENVELEKGEAEHTLVMYMLANNNLEMSIFNNVLDAEEGMVGAMPSTRLLIYLDKRTETTLYEVSYLPYGADNHIKQCKVLKSYPQQTSTTPQVMRSVMEDVKVLAPSKSYGLVLAGHGTGWFPKPSSGTSYDQQKVAPMMGVGVNGGWQSEYFFGYERFMEPETRAMGYDLVAQEDGTFARTDESFISAAEIVEGISPIHFDYIIFDACFMSSIEFLYDMRHSADYILASPVEVLGVGLPYTPIVGNLMSPRHNLGAMCDLIKDVYVRDNEFSVRKSLALALIDCAQLEPLADIVAEIYRSVEEGDYQTTIAKRIDMERLQPLDRMLPPAFYDFEDFVCELAGEGELRERFLEQLAKVVVDVEHTEDIYSIGYTPDGMIMGYENIEKKIDGVLDLCGINTYVPFRNVPVTLSHYFQTDWAKKVYNME